MSIAIAPNVPPQDLDAEESVLGAMLMSDVAADEVAAALEPRDFYREAHGTVFRAILQLQARSEPVDVITVTDQLVTMGKLEEVGGRPYVHGLADSVPAAANARRYAEIVRELAQLRRLIAAGTEIAQRGYERSGPVRELIDDAEARIFQVSQQGADAGQLRAIADLLKEEFERIDRLSADGKDLTGAPSGLRDLDRLTSGFQASNLIILAARPSMGKTSMALGIARHLGVSEGVPVAIFSLEMSHSEITQRLMCAEGHVDSGLLRRGNLRDDDWRRLIEGCDRLNRAPIYIDDSAGIGVMEIRSKARRLKAREPGLGLIVIDYLQLMSGNAENRVQEISQISRSLKMLARDLDVPVIALSQLSRAVEARPDKRPMLSDLRESGSIEQDADVVMFIYRDEYYDKENPDNKGLAEVILAKHRNGATGKVDVAFRAKYTLFSDLSRDGY
jgi:replicative DNA helicase